MNEDKLAKFRMQEIHTPSAFEGALWVMMGVKDARTILHSPPGCYINQHVGAQVNDWFVELYSSNLPYGSIMQGGEDRLESVMRKTAARGPEAIFVVTAPPVEVAQEDVEGVAGKVGYKNTVVVRPPIGGTLGDGKDAALLALCDIMEPAAGKRERSVNIIGPTCSTFNWMADVFELRRMLAGIGVEVNAVLSAGATVAEIRQAPRAALNVCIYPFDCGVPLAKEMEARFGVPYVDDIIPIGFENSARWLQRIADAFNIEAKPFLKTSIESAYEFICSPMVFPITFEMTAALSFENHATYAVGIAEFYTAEAGADIVMSSVCNPAAAERLRTVCPEVLVSPTIEQKRDKFIETSPMAIFGNFYDKKVSLDEGFQNFIFADIPSIGYLNTENCPFMGFHGAKYLVQCLVNEVYMGIFLETKGQMEGPISHGDVKWEVAADQAMMKISEMIPHFVRATAIKKLHQIAEEIAVARGSTITLAIVREVADKYTPTKFKAKFSTVFGDDAVSDDAPAAAPEMPAMDFDDAEDVPIDSLEFTLQWEDETRQMLEMVPSPFRQAAVEGTEEYAREHAFEVITPQVMDAYRKELGM